MKGVSKDHADFIVVSSSLNASLKEDTKILLDTTERVCRHADASAAILSFLLLFLYSIFYLGMLENERIGLSLERPGLMAMRTI